MNDSQPELKTGRSAPVHPSPGWTAQLQLLIFDLDGVITSEARYWQTARLTVWDLITQPDFLGLRDYWGADLRDPEAVLAAGDQVIAPTFIAELKRRGINSNWDLTFFVLSLQVIAILAQLDPPRLHRALAAIPDPDAGAAQQLQTLGSWLPDPDLGVEASKPLIQRFWEATVGLQGTAVTDFVPTFATQVLGRPLPLLESRSGLWELCYEQFQAWYDGHKGLVLPGDEMVLPLTLIRKTLHHLAKHQHLTLAIATGRPRREVIQPLLASELLDCFDGDRIVTYDEVLAAEALMAQAGQPLKLGKPHPFILLKAISPGTPVPQLLAQRQQHYPEVAYVGDAASDVMAAQQAHCKAIGVLTGFTPGKTRDQKQSLFRELNCDAVLDSILDLPQWLAQL